jgi:hypothetical protein
VVDRRLDGALMGAAWNYIVSGYLRAAGQITIPGSGGSGACFWPPGTGRCLKTNTIRHEKRFPNARPAGNFTLDIRNHYSE